MKDFKWYWNRLRAMSPSEILWRLGQKRQEKAERSIFGKQHVQITEGVFYQGKEDLVFHGEKLPTAEPSHEKCGQEESGYPCGPVLLGGYDYNIYKKDWCAGFQTQNKWPPEFSYDLQYKQRDDIGDARTNWELNRHFQFAFLACHYHRTGREEYLTELSDLFHDWNEQNPFLHGISWTSVMETAIRDINWMYTLGFLRLAAEDGGAGRGERARKDTAQLCRALENGIINMTGYLSAHYSRYSSANNHVIVEAAAMGIAGIVMECGEWYDTAFSILQYEIERQNYRDGVNKEASLHYQSFFMEAVGLLALTMKVNNIHVPQKWRNILCAMSRYVSDCRGRYGETVVFGDDDEGKILDLYGASPAGGGGDGAGSGRGKRDHYQYVLELMSLILPERYTETVTDRTLLAIAPEKGKERLSEKPYYRNTDSVCYEEGGVSLLKSRDGRAFIGVDHGALGFGSIAAHGHADSLSFQMYLEGAAVFADAGTYIYHTELGERNYFRRTENHNTVTVGGKDQSEMLGAFLWGRRAETTLLAHDFSGERAVVEAEHDGYAPVIHRRRFEFDGDHSLVIRDKLLHVEKETEYQVNFMLGAGCRAAEKALGSYEIITGTGRRVSIRIQAPLITTAVRDAWMSAEYGRKEATKRIQVEGRTDTDVTIVTAIEWEEW